MKFVIGIFALVVLLLIYRYLCISVINFTSCYTEGPPKDEGEDFTDRVPLIKKNAQGHFNEIILHTPTTMRNLGYGKYLGEYRDTPIIRHKIGLKLGLAAFRPVIFLHELSKMNDGDILFHRDCDHKKNPAFANFDGIEDFIKKCLDICQFDFFIPNHDLPGGDVHIDTTRLTFLTKTNIIRELGENHPFTYNFPMLHAYMFIMKKSPATMELLTEWKEAMEHREWVDGETYGEMHPEFTWSTLDQSVLSVIIANWVRKGKHNIPKKYPFIALRDKDHHKIIYHTDYDYLKYL
jgi:hypothetical protein